MAFRSHWKANPAGFSCRSHHKFNPDNTAGKFAMIQQTRSALSILAGVAILVSPAVATAQWFPTSNCGCATRPVPVVQQCFRQVPVTEYQQVKQKVRRPVTEVEYIEQPVVRYRPVTETKTVDVPVTQYQDVVEYQTVNRQCGQWVTNYYPNPKMTACQYDPRPTPMGMLNRAAYRVRSALTPSGFVRRQYVPQAIAQQVPIRRRVAVQTIQKRSYQVTKYVKEQTTRKVAVNRVRWVEDEVIALKPVTVVKTIPATQTAWAMQSFGTAPVATAWIPAPAVTTTALRPTADPISRAANSPNRTATRSADEAHNEAADERGDINRINNTVPRRSAIDPVDRTTSQRARTSRAYGLFVPVSPRSASRIARAGGWRASSRNTAPTRKPTTTGDAPILLSAMEVGAR